MRVLRGGIEPGFEIAPLAQLRMLGRKPQSLPAFVRVFFLDECIIHNMSALFAVLLVFGPIEKTEWFHMALDLTGSYTHQQIGQML